MTANGTIMKASEGGPKSTGRGLPSSRRGRGEASSRAELGRWPRRWRETGRQLNGASFLSACLCPQALESKACALQAQLLYQSHFLNKVTSTSLVVLPSLRIFSRSNYLPKALPTRQQQSINAEVCLQLMAVGQHIKPEQ